MDSSVSRASAAKALTAGQRCTRAFLILLGVTAMGLAVSAGDMPEYVRVFAVGFAFLFLHAAANGPAIAEPGLSLRKSAMPRLPRILLALAEILMTLGMAYFFVGKIFGWSA